MESMRTVLTRIAAELDAVSARLSALEIAQHGSPPQLSADTVVALQELDRTEQVARSLADVLRCVASSGAADTELDVGTLVADVRLEGLQASIAGASRTQAPAGDVDFF